MQVMKEKWENPNVVLQVFKPNEYIASCWGVACDTVAANDYEAPEGYEDNGWHNKWTGCGVASHQYLITSKDANGKDVVTGMYESKPGTDPQCTLYWDDEYNTKKDSAGKLVDNVRAFDTLVFGVKEMLYWITDYYGVRYYHQGMIEWGDKANGNPS